MNWLLIALITPLAMAAVNHLDKFLISKYMKGDEVGALVLFSSLFAIVALPIVAWIEPAVFSVSLIDALLLMVNGALIVLAYICYFYALNQDETSIVVPLFQLIPLFGFALSYFFLGETLSRAQSAGSLIVISGALLLSLSFANQRLSLKKGVLFLMVGSSLLYAISAVLFKFVAVSQQRFWPSLFWDFLGKLVAGLVIFFTISSYRRQFLGVLRENKKTILALNSLNEILGIVGEAAFALATLLAPVALVQVVGGFQPMFVFLYGIVLTLLFPGLVKESLASKDLAQKTIGIATIILGTVILSL